MANYRVRSAAAGANNGTTWADAYTTLAAALAVATAADTIWVADDHAESQITTMTLTGPTSPGLRVLCVNTHTVDPPTGLATSATVSIGAGSVGMTLTGHAYYYGITFQGGTNNSSACVLQIGFNASVAHALSFENCNWNVRTVHNSGGPLFGVSNTSLLQSCEINLLNCGVRFGGTGQSIRFSSGRLIWSRGGFIDSAGSAPTTLFTWSVSCASDVLIENCDWSAESVTNLFAPNIQSPSRVKMRNCKLPSGIAIVTGAAPSPGGPTIEVYNCDSTDTNYRLAVHRAYTGSIVSETGIVCSGGANDGTTSYSWKMSTTANASYPSAELHSPELSKFNSQVNVSITASVEILHDAQGSSAGSPSGRFLDDEIWMELRHLGTNGFPLGVHLSDCKLSVMATAAEQDYSSASWTTTGMANPVKQKLSVTFTPQEVGMVQVCIVLAKASAVCYVNPKITFSTDSGSFTEKMLPGYGYIDLAAGGGGGPLISGRLVQ